MHTNFILTMISLLGCGVAVGIATNDPLWGLATATGLVNVCNIVLQSRR